MRSIRKKFIWFLVVLVGAIVFVGLHNFLSSLYGEESFRAAIFFLLFFAALLVALVLFFVMIFQLIFKKKKQELSKN